MNPRGPDHRELKLPADGAENTIMAGCGWVTFAKHAYYQSGRGRHLIH